METGPRSKGPSSPAIELANAELLRQEGEVTPLIVDLYAGVNYLRVLAERLRRPTKDDESERPTPRSAWLNRF